MAIIQFNIPEEDISLKDLANSVAIIMKDLQWAINGNLDVKNIRADTITADRLHVDTLSAITANIGEVTSGIVTGALIRTANGTYPRIELSSSGNLLRAYYNASTYIDINPGIGGALDPILEFVSATTTSQIGNFHVFGDVFYFSSNKDVLITSSANDVRLEASTGHVSATSSAGTIADLVTSINSLNSSVTSLNTSVSTLNASVASLSANKADHGSTSTNGLHNHGIANGTVLMTDTGTVTWVESGSHSHTI